eukprot:2221016-Pyramimonas_sp.AAC.1
MGRRTTWEGGPARVVALTAAERAGATEQRARRDLALGVAQEEPPEVSSSNRPILLAACVALLYLFYYFYASLVVPLRASPEKRTAAGVVYRAQGPALGSWEDRPPTAYSPNPDGLVQLEGSTSDDRGCCTWTNTPPAWLAENFN